jgi:hypothetical protein
VGSRVYRAPYGDNQGITQAWAEDDHRTADVADVLEDSRSDVPHTRQAVLDRVPQIAQRNRHAHEVVPTEFYLYQRLAVGRRCSCWEVEDEPQALCPICWGTGVVSGYQKLGTKVVTVDVTHPGLSAVNVIPGYGLRTRPIFFTLIDTALYGTVTTEINLPRSVGQLDVEPQFTSYAPGDLTAAEIYCRTPGEEHWVLLTQASVEQRISSSRLQIRFVLRRDRPEAGIPKISHVRLVFKLKEDTGIIGNIPRNLESQSLEDFGILDAWSSQQFVFGPDLRNIATQDFLVQTAKGYRWKVTEIQPNDILGINTSWDVTCRIVQDYEGINEVP